MVFGLHVFGGCVKRWALGRPNFCVSLCDHSRIGGLDVLVFTGGIGEHAAPLRARVCQDGQWLGVRLNAQANRIGGPKISADDSTVSVWVIPADEDVMSSRHTYNIIGASLHQPPHQPALHHLNKQ
jgi:hypothetical protein